MARPSPDHANPIAAFTRVPAPSEAYALFRDHVSVRVEVEEVSLSLALGRTLAKDVQSPLDLPSFPRSTVDGYAVRAVDTAGSSTERPTTLHLLGESLMGQMTFVHVTPGSLVKIHTGAMLPDGADAVAMVEDTRDVGDNRIELYRSVAPGDNRIATGEDVRQGDFLLGAGHLLRPQDIGGLAAVGLTRVPVARKPRVTIISGGDEVVPPEVEPGPAQVRDINSFVLEALVRECGGEPMRMGIATDRYEVLHGMVAEALTSCDVIIVSGGSSVGTRDVTRAVIDDYGDPGVLIHGVALRPGKPTILAVVRGTPFFGLPGNPISAICTFGLFVRPTILRFLGQPDQPPPVTVTATLLRDIASPRDLEQYVQVRLLWQDGHLYADPVLGKSNLIFLAVRAHGVVVLPLQATGMAAGTAVEVQPYGRDLPMPDHPSTNE